MKAILDKKLFFSMTYDFLTVYIPQDSSSLCTVKSYRDGLTIFRRYVEYSEVAEPPNLLE